MTDAEKREKQIVLKKLAEMEEELKVGISYAISYKYFMFCLFQLLALSENLTDQVKISKAKWII